MSKYGYSKEAAIFCAAVKKLASKPENLENLENYLSYHFDDWLENFADTPERMAAELFEFAKMGIL